MTINYKLSFDDLLYQQIYAATHSALYASRNKRSRLLVPILYVLGGGIFILKPDTQVVGSIFVVLGVTWYLLHPKFMKVRYKQYYAKYIRKNHADSIDKEVELTITENGLVTKSGSSESKMGEDELGGLIETTEYFMFRVVSNAYMCIPKKYIDDKNGFKEEALKLDIQYIDETDWEW